MPSDPSTFNRWLGLRLVREHRDGVTIECKLRPELLNGAGILHGGITATMADNAVGMAIWRRFGGKRLMTTVEMKLNYLRPMSEGKIVARSRLVRVGKTLCVGSADLFNAKKQLVAVALVTYMLLPKSPEPGSKFQ